MEADLINLFMNIKYKLKSFGRRHKIKEEWKQKEN